MSKLDRLIAELCPDGVEYKRLDEICQISRGVRLVRSQLVETGKYPVYQNSMTPLGYNNGYNTIANTVFIISAGAAGEIGYSTIDFWAADDCLCFACLESLISRYLYYVLLCQQKYIVSRVRRASVPRLSRTVVEQLKIPIPPLPVQREIVRILDNFTELTAELTARRKQYEYYRNVLLTFENGVPMVALGEIAKMIRGTYVTKKNTVRGNIPVILGGQEPAYYCDTSNHEGEAIVVSRSGAYAGFVSFWNEPIFITDGFILEAKEDIVIKYLFYSLKNMQEYLHGTKRGGGVPHVRGNEIMKIKIPVPSLTEQIRIVAILDRIDVLSNDISNGLPAEIAARQKQYEYYRDKLLTFKGKAA